MILGRSCLAGFYVHPASPMLDGRAGMLPLYEVMETSTFFGEALLCHPVSLGHATFAFPGANCLMTQECRAPS